MRVILLFWLTISLTLVPAAAQRAAAPVKQSTDTAKYIGLRHGKALPPGLKWIGGSLVSAVRDEKEYGMTEIHRGTTKMLWFERMTHRDDNGTAYWEVKDVMVLPRISKKQVFLYAFCLLNNQHDSEIAAVADYDADAQYFTRVCRAWRANRQTEKFEAILTKGIKCENPGLGL